MDAPSSGGNRSRTYKVEGEVPRFVCCISSAKILLYAGETHWASILKQLDIYLTQRARRPRGPLALDALSHSG